MNDHRVLQNLTEGGWKTTGLIKKAEEGIQPGIYNLFVSKAAETQNGLYEGILLFVDKQQGIVYQQINREFVTHQLALFSSPPPIGKTVSIQYENEKLTLRKTDIIVKKRTMKI